MKWFLLILVCLPAMAGQEGRGGDSYVWDFKSTAQDIGSWMEKNQRNLNIPLSAQLFREAVSGASISSTVDADEVKAAGETREAVTFPEQNRIVIYRPLYSLIHSERRKWLIVLHETLHLLAKNNPRLEDGDYKVSSQILRYRFRDMTRPEDLFDSMASCNQVILLEGLPAAIRVVETRTNPQGKVDAYLVRRYFPNSNTAPRGEQNTEMKIAQDMTCKYSTTKAGLMECRSNWGSSEGTSEFSITRTSFSRSDWDMEKVETKVHVYSPLIQELTENNRIALIGREIGLSRDQEPNPQEFLDRMKKGILPIFTEELSWNQARLFDRIGNKAFGSSFTFPRAQCGFLKPKL